MLPEEGGGAAGDFVQAVPSFGVAGGKGGAACERAVAGAKKACCFGVRGLSRVAGPGSSGGGAIERGASDALALYNAARRWTLNTSASNRPFYYLVRWWAP